MGKNNLMHARTCVYNVNYHIVFSAKYRKTVLKGGAQKYLKQLSKEKADEKRFKIATMKIMEDHVHLYVSAHPKIALSYIVKMLKGISARKLLLTFPELTK